MQANKLLKLRGLLVSQHASARWMAEAVAAPWSRSATNKADSEEAVGFTIAENHNETKTSVTYEEIKEAARRSGGDPVKEWFSGPASGGSTIYKAAKADANELYVSTKRGIEEGTTWHDSLRDHRFTSEGGSEGENPGILGKAKEKLHNAADSLEHGMDNMKEAFGGAASSLASMTGSDSGNEPINARSVWEESRSEEQKAVANANRKAQLTDEAYGTDNPSEATPRFDKDTVPDPLDTPH